jgi:TonB family protein
VPGLEHGPAASASDQQMPAIVFLATESPSTGGGGGGGGNQQPGPIRRAQGVGTDKLTLRTRQPLPLRVTAVPDRVEDVPPFPSILLDVEPPASGVLEQVGLPTGGSATGTSTGTGSGGGVGTGVGTGIGPGRGPGLGPGSGGGTGGGIYRAGGPVSWPRLIKEVRPHYTESALRNMTQGRVAMEAVITRDGCPTDMRIIRSLDRGGLDEEAIAAVAQWRFEPGRLNGVPVNVLVMIVVDFSIR